jgi:hypothetical protein
LLKKGATETERKKKGKKNAAKKKSGRKQGDATLQRE